MKKRLFHILAFSLTAIIVGCSSVEVVAPNTINHSNTEKYYISKIQWVSGNKLRIEASKTGRLSAGDKVNQDDLDLAGANVGALYRAMIGYINADLQSSPLMQPGPLSRVGAVLTIEPVKGYYGLVDETLDLTLIVSLRVGNKNVWMEAMRVPGKKQDHLSAARNFETKLLDEMKADGLF